MIRFLNAVFMKEYNHDYTITSADSGLRRS